MSSITSARPRPARSPAGATSPRLVVVPRSSARAARVPFVALVVGLLIVGLVGLLVLNTSLQRGAYVVTDLRTQAAQLSLREQNLQMQVAGLQSPERLAAVAAASGMVRNDHLAFLSLKTGKVVGVPKAGSRANSVMTYGGRNPATSSKVLTVPAGSYNNASTGLEHEKAAADKHSSAQPGTRLRHQRDHSARTAANPPGSRPTTPRTHRSAR